MSGTFAALIGTAEDRWLVAFCVSVLVVLVGASFSEVDYVRFPPQGFTLTEHWRCEQGASDHPAVGARLEASF